jgi:hypothetical protein
MTSKSVASDAGRVLRLTRYDDAAKRSAASALSQAAETYTFRYRAGRSCLDALANANRFNLADYGMGRYRHNDAGEAILEQHARELLFRYNLRDLPYSRPR